MEYQIGDLLFNIKTKEYLFLVGKDEHDIHRQIYICLYLLDKQITKYTYYFLHDNKNFKKVV